MKLKIRAWDKNRKKLLSWEELLAGREFKAKLKNPEAFGLELMLATGLSDCYGHEIYEGDVLVDLHSAEWAVVEYARGSFIAYDHLDYVELDRFIGNGTVRIDRCVFEDTRTQEHEDTSASKRAEFKICEILKQELGWGFDIYDQCKDEEGR